MAGPMIPHHTVLNQPIIRPEGSDFRSDRTIADLQWADCCFALDRFQSEQMGFLEYARGLTVIRHSE
jgi:hypothetical protein